MNRQEPYIGMPIRFDDFDDMPVTCCGELETGPQPSSRRAEPERKPAPNPGGQQGHGSASNTGGQRGHGGSLNQAIPNAGANQGMQPMALAMAYVPWQRWTETYPLDEGLQKGTIFPDLYLPFEGRRKGGKRR